MGSIILGNVGAAIGAAIAGPMGADFGKNIGASLGSEFENNLFQKKYLPKIGPKLFEITMQTASYGKMIPIIYGTAKLAGNIIWASEMKEKRQDHYQKRSKFGGKVLVASEFTYSISLAIAIGEGEVNEILRVWADDQLIDPRKSIYRFYNGSEEQLPDPLIEAIEGYGRTPAFRGLSYVVIEELQLAEFGNRIPTFLFEVKRKINNAKGEKSLEERIKAMVMIPGSGEFVYDTEVQSKLPKNYNPKFGNFNFQKSKINQNNREGKADSLVALDQLQDTCPNLEWVAPVVSWFTGTINAANAKIIPGIEYKDSSTTPDLWQVGKFNRENAHLITKNQYSSPIYGGTSNDLSILRYLSELRNRGYKIMFYPMVLVDQEHKPWRGRITGHPDAVRNFFYGENGYNEFILHYARLVKDKVDAFVIGSEMIGLTKVKENKSFPAVDALVDLARQVKEIMGKNVKITYAADWSEYHHTENAWYNLDPLWASEDIDFIGIDAYFPLTNSNKAISGEEQIIKAWQSGEGYEYYYSDAKKTKKRPLKPAYAWKNIKHWWENEHINPDGAKTSWRPKSKKIWFTEIGFPSVDLASNQPNVFYSPDSIESSFPIHSNGRVDFLAQREALSASEKYWRGSEFLEQMFVWCWDARPYPYWPDLMKVWSDGGCWSRGHWVNGKLGLSSLKSLIQDLCIRAGLSASFIKAEELTDLIDGVVIHEQESAKAIINLLKTAYFFDSHETNGELHFVKRINRGAVSISKDELVACNGSNKYALEMAKSNPADAVQSVAVHYFNSSFDYQNSVEITNNYCGYSNQTINVHLPIIVEAQRAKTIADVILQEIWQGQICYSFAIGSKYLDVKPNDVIYLFAGEESKLHGSDEEFAVMRVIETSMEIGKILKVKAISIKENIYHMQAKMNNLKENLLVTKEHYDPGETELVMLNLPRLPFEVAPFGVYLGVIGNDSHWRGAMVNCPDGSSLYFPRSLTFGVIEEEMENSLKVNVFSGELESKSKQELERYGNLAVIGEEVIQFAMAELLTEGIYKLSGVKREMFGSLRSNSNKFILLDNNLQKLPVSEMQIGKNLEFLVTSIGHNYEQEKRYEFEYCGNG